MKWDEGDDDDPGGSVLFVGCWAVIAGAVLLAARWLAGG